MREAFARLAAQGELASNYFGVRQADLARALQEAVVAGYQRNMQITNNRYSAGVVARTDTLQAESQLANARADLLGLEQQRATFEHAVAVLVGRAPAHFDIWSSNDAELPDDLLRARELLLILVLREMLVPKTATEVANVPSASAILADLHVPRAREHLLIERVRDHLAQRMPDTPVLKHALDVEIELFHDTHDIGRARPVF